MLTGAQIREMFLEYFEQHGHRRVHSSSLVPANDPTLLFTNAGMNQFKDVFLGLEKRDYSRATTSQKCVRAGGKHNDLENVGFTNRHHTFFEMLGNFSFGDYFKREAIAFGWELITSPKWYGIPKDRLFATIFKGEQGVPRDEEAFNFWVEQGVPKDRIYEFGMKDNFWAMGDTGPCGPCSEIHYDMGAIASDQGHADCKFGCECGRYVELWNLVFMQFNRDASGKLEPLPKPSIDTGAGLERIAAVLQGKLSNYDTDFFVALMKRAAELTGVSLDKELQKESGSRGAASLRVIADHARATTFLISDGVLPSNEGRGYVLRKIMRRAIRHGRLLGQNEPFLYQMVYAVRDQMKDAYPELVDSADRVSTVVQGEEVRFAHTLASGEEKRKEIEESVWVKWLEEALEEFADVRRITLTYDKDSRRILRWFLPGNTGQEISAETAARMLFGEARGQEFLAYLFGKRLIERPPVFPGDQAFRLYDTFGLPLDFMIDAARDQGLAFDQKGFDTALEQQRERSYASWKGAAKQAASPAFQKLPPTSFEGYLRTESHDSEVLAIIDPRGQGVHQLKPGEHGEIVLDRTPFYAEAGGQVGDIGWLYDSDHNTVVADVTGCYYPVQGVRAHKVTAKQAIRVGERVDPVVNTGVREATMRNHTATHLLHAALREVLGKHVKQAGSLVDPRHLRFDFSHFTGIADEELQGIEDLANKEVLKNEKVEIIPDVPLDVAINEYKAMALFGEKYGERVRVIRIGDFSTELCGGTHTAMTGEIGLVKVLDEGSVSSGVRRVEAVTGMGSLGHFRQDHELEHVVSSLVHRAEPAVSPAEALRLELERKEAEIKRLSKELERVRMKSATATVSSAEEKVQVVEGIKVLAHRVDNLERPQMRTLVDNLRSKLGSGVVVLGSTSDGKVALIVGVTKDLTSRVQAGKIIGPVAERVGGSGGGRPDMAEAGGKNPENLDDALAQVPAVVKSLLK
ncbi:MAG TPA: alanine--tRNA ligase [Terriglobales bacterium]|nr:alanine--tRNA ligase [Terriglobales bacterium]